MYVVYNQGLGAYLTMLGWKTQPELERNIHNLIAITEKSDLNKIIQRLDVKYVKSISKGCALIDVATFKTTFPTPKLSFTKPQNNTIKNGAVRLVEVLIELKATTINSNEYFPTKTLPNTNTNPNPNTTPNKKTSNKQNHKQNIEDLARIKKELRFNNEYINQTKVITKMVNNIYEQSKEISIYYPKILREIDGQIQDELHYVEFHKLNIFKAHKLSKKLHKLRIKRRNIKDKISTANWFLDAINDLTIEELNNLAFRIEKLNDRRYYIRDPKSFKHNVIKKAEIE